MLEMKGVIKLIVHNMSMEFELDLNSVYSEYEIKKLKIKFSRNLKGGQKEYIRVRKGCIEEYFVKKLEEGRYEVLTRFMNYTPFTKSKP
jgi:hypothetical protein